jgi:DNA topoisomerase-1
MYNFIWNLICTYTLQAPGLSAGRVQSVGMAMTVRRERERLTFQETEYWSVKGNFSATVKNNNNEDIDRLLETQLISINGQTLASGTSDFNPKQTDELASQDKIHLKEKSAAELINLIHTHGKNWMWTIRKVTSSQRKQKPSQPFITSSFQQEANRRLGLSVSGSMRVAQQLYEKGFISYMRTDSTHLSLDAQNAIEIEITKEFGGREKYVSTIKPEPQAAHEAIRPAVQEDGQFLKPDDLPPSFDKAATEVYKLIYQRTVASHMTPQISNQTSIIISGESDDADEDNTEFLFRTSGSVVVDPGYTIAYPRQVDSKSIILPIFEEGQNLHCDDVEGLFHMTQPPARYTEASFVQELEKLGVGRPSTYAGTVQILRDRAYIGSPVTSDSNRRGGPKEVSGPAIFAQRAAGGEDFTGSNNARGPLVPSLTAFVVTSLLEEHCTMYVDPTFTAKMEERLDKIANSENEIGKNERLSYLNEFYQGEEGLAAKIKNIDQFVDADVARRANLPALASNSIDNVGEIGLFIGPWGPYIKKTSITDNDNEKEKSITASLPPGMASDISTITHSTLNALLKTKEQGGLILGQHPEDGRSIRLKVGPYGEYLQWGDDGEDGTSTHTLPRELRSFKKSEMESLDQNQKDEPLADMIGPTLEEAIQYVSLPRTVCLMDDLPIEANLGPYGPYLKYNATFMSLKPKDGDVLTIDADKATELVTGGIVNQKSKFSAGVLAEIGEMDGSMISVKQGRFGEYINWKKVNAKLPRDYLEDPSELPLGEAWSLIQEKVAPKPGKSSRKKKTPDSDLPPAPKRPKSSYFIFCAEKRPEAASKLSSLGEVSKELSRLWSELTDDDKKPYIEMAATVKSAYGVEKGKWEEETKDMRKSKRGKTVAKGSSTTLPKRPRSAYIYFCGSNRAEVTKDHNSLGEISKELGRRWKNLDAAAKSEYETMSAEDKLRYTREKGESKRSSSMTTSNLNEKKPSPKPKKKSSYMLFCASHRSQVLDENGQKMSLPETTKVLAQMWRECNDETRKTFTDQAEVQNQESQGVSSITA